ncbi:MAG TPA: hypothetical protein DCL49_02915 [Candidatus Omnitrophica bacterium]|nr:hypothetical protein [Candidatus Omnitrophota bacterium]HBG63461.1 hypothetical protein [Candidatus Omnitrophota bacterium]
MSMRNKPHYYLNQEGTFVIENYHMAKPFSSFFPGIAGVWGIPLWAFYVNRGQAIASFGIKDKDHPILEFYPANKAYQFTSLLGFRTFIKIAKGKKDIFYDAFHNGASSLCFDIENKMYINASELKLKELNRTLGLEVEVEYFSIPNDNYAALARRLFVRNVSKHTAALEFLDGLPQIIPYGMNTFLLKEMSRTIEAWMDVENLENGIAYLRLRQDPADRPEVAHISEGNFYAAFDGQSLIAPIVDPRLIFGSVSDFTYPQSFMSKAAFRYPHKQLTTSRTPCSFAYRAIKLKPHQVYSLYSLIGSMDSLQKLKLNAKRITSKDYFFRKQAENRKVITDIESVVETHSSSKSLDFYTRQNFLDNVLRGGCPVAMDTKSGKINIQLFSRKHGDPERDYNRFLLEPTYLSQGNGNYRDANQNRRSDIWFNPAVKESGLFTFFNLLQADGYNPLILKPDQFLFQGRPESFNRFFKSEDAKKVKKLLEKPFTPGELFFFIEHTLFKGLKVFEKKEEFLSIILAHSARILSAEHGEGFWIDHWAYCLDLLEAYISLYPEKLQHILVEHKEFTFFDNSEVLRPRSERYVVKDAKVFQYHSVVNNHAKLAMIKKRGSLAHVMRARRGQGDIYKTSLFVKMLVVIANKFSSLDPCGVGVEMEANKPNWYDALNGLPGLLGSSTCETFELKRWLIFIKENLANMALGNGYSILLPVEAYDLLRGLGILARSEVNEYDFWDKSHALREEYLKRTLMGFEGQEIAVSLSEVDSIAESFLKKIDSGLKKAYDTTRKLYFSYFINEVTEYENVEAHEHGHCVKPKEFSQKPLPLFLEGIVHSLRVTEDQAEAKKIFQSVRGSPLYDRKLRMYKVNAPLKDMPEEIGRCRVFTPGWLENESIWLHMEYKYILELLKNGLYDEFFEDFKNVLIPFQNPERYGRSILENSSFLVSSAFPDETLHGNGFVARLSGSTAEFISIWLLMCVGKKPFYLDKDKKLCLEFKPALPSWLFSQKAQNGLPKNTFAFKFLTKTLVVYHNQKRKDTFGPQAAKMKEITITYGDTTASVIAASVISSPAAQNIREGKASRIDIVLS